MKNVLLLILLFLNINSSDIDEKLWQNYGIIYGTTNPYFKIKLESENIRGDSHGLLKIRHRNLQKIVEAQTRFLNEIDSIITDTNKEKKKGFTLLKLCDFYFNASEKIPDNICRLKNKFNEFENKSKQYIDEKKQDEYIPKIKYNNNGVSWDKKIFIMKNQADEANEKCIKDDFWCNGEKITDEFINAEIECLFVKNRYDKNIYSTIKTDYYNNCHIFLQKYANYYDELVTLYKRESNKKSISEEENNEISVLVKTIFGLSIIGLIPVFLDLINKLISSNILNEIGKYKFFKLFQNKIAVSLFSLLFLGSATSMILTKYSSKKNQMPNTD